MTGTVSKNFESAPNAIPKSAMAAVFIICLFREIFFSALRMLFRKFNKNAPPPSAPQIPIFLTPRSEAAVGLLLAGKYARIYSDLIAKLYDLILSLPHGVFILHGTQAQSAATFYLQMPVKMLYAFKNALTFPHTCSRP